MDTPAYAAPPAVVREMYGLPWAHSATTSPPLLPVVPGGVRVFADGAYEYLADASEHRGRWVGRFEAALRRLRGLQPGWDEADAPPPTPESIERAVAVLEMLWHLSLGPSRVAPTIDGGVAFTFFSGVGRAAVDVEPDGTVSIEVPGRRGDDLHALADDDEVRESLEALREALALGSAQANAPEWPST